MSFFPSGPSPVSTVSLQGANTPTIAHVVVALASTEVSYTLPANTKRFLIKLQGLAKLQLAFSAGTSGSTYLTIEQGSAYSEADLSLPGGLTLYFQTSKPAQIAEIISWA